MITIVNEYKNYLEELSKLISNSDFKAQYFMKVLGLKTATYYRKLRENSFTISEVEIITKALYPKEVYKQELLDSIEIGRQDFKEGKTMTSEEMRIVMRKRIENYQ